MRIALASLDQHWKDKETNFRRCRELASTARQSSCSLVIFPEMTLTGYTMDVSEIVEAKEQSPTLEQFGRLALELSTEIIFGACLASPGWKRPRNTLCQARSDGTVSVIYQKIHPFSFAGEDEVFEAGDRLASVQVGALKMGCSICYDLRFPEPFAIQAQQCNAFVNIANWPASRVGHWRALLVARAIENQSFLIGVNRTGIDGKGIAYESSSMVVRPDGELLEPETQSPEIGIYDLDPELASEYRRSFPTLRDKRRDFYRHLTP